MTLFFIIIVVSGVIFLAGNCYEKICDDKKKRSIEEDRD